MIGLQEKRGVEVLRWALATVTALVAVSFVALLVFADGFRRSFGASANGPLTIGVPLAVMLVVLASLLWPGQRMLLHVTAAVVLGLAACSVWVLGESAFLGTAGLLFSGLWSLWYWNAAWASPATLSS